MSQDQIKEAEQRGYSRGYNAGRKRLKKQIEAEQLQRKKNEFYNQALLAALPSCVLAQGWKHGEKPISSVLERIELADHFAREALKFWRMT